MIGVISLIDTMVSRRRGESPRVLITGYEDDLKVNYLCPRLDTDPTRSAFPLSHIVFLYPTDFTPLSPLLPNPFYSTKLPKKKNYSHLI
jgi:hypothetical protein